MFLLTPKHSANCVWDHSSLSNSRSVFFEKAWAYRFHNISLKNFGAYSDGLELQRNAVNYAAFCVKTAKFQPERIRTKIFRANRLYKQACAKSTKSRNSPRAPPQYLFYGIHRVTTALYSNIKEWKNFRKFFKGIIKRLCILKQSCIILNIDRLIVIGKV